MEQMRLDFGEGAEAERAMETAARASRARAFEAAAVALGIRPGEVAYKLAGTLAVYADSPSQRAMGLTGLRWCGTWAELAADPRLSCSADSIAKAIRRSAPPGLSPPPTKSTTAGWLLAWLCPSKCDRSTPPVEVNQSALEVKFATVEVKHNPPPEAAPEAAPETAPETAPDPAPENRRPTIYRLYRNIRTTRHHRAATRRRLI